MKYIYSSLLFTVLVVFVSHAKEMDQMKLTSSHFSHEAQIPSQFTCDGQDSSPALTWESIPDGTKSFALIVDDPDAPRGTWVHWVLYNIPPDVTHLPDGARDFPKLGIQGTNSFQKKDYGGPCPPSGSHRYYFKLYALDKILELSAGATKEQLKAAMKGHTLGKATLIGLYARHQP